MNLEANMSRSDEIVFPNDSTMIMQKINAQIVEFNPQGTLVAIGCKYASILIMDFMTKEMIRCFSIYEDYDLEANQDVDQFSNFRRLNYAYLEDDFILHQKPQDEKESESIVKREYKKIIQFEPKDKVRCKAQISSIDWSLDGKYIVACFRLENQVAVWDVLNCNKVFHQTSLQLGTQIHQAKFHALNPNYILLSGEKALIVRSKQELIQEVVLVSENLEAHQDSQGKLDVSTQMIQQQNKRKGPKFTSNIFQTLVQDGKTYFLLINNNQKVIMILQEKVENQIMEQQQNKVHDFFKINSPKKTDQDKEMKDISKSQQQQESDDSSELDDDRDLIGFEDKDQITEAINSINQQKFKIISMIKFQSSNSFVQIAVVNDNYTNILMTCSDRVLRLYEIRYENIGVHRKIIFLKNEFQDVINRRKWMNACFLKLNHNTRVVEQQSQNSKADAAQLLNESKQLLYSQSFNQKSEQLNMELKDAFHYQQEIFVSSIGESGSNELKFYNVDDFSIIQRLELTQEGCSYLTAHSKAHFSIFLVTTNGSLFLWSTRPAKIIQPLAPYFTEIEENKEYIEKEEEFEKEPSDLEEIKNDDKLTEDQLRKNKLAKTIIDITTIDQDHLFNYTQLQARKIDAQTNHLESLFQNKLDNMEYQFNKYMTYVPIQVSNHDTYGLLAKLNVDTFREKFSKVQQ